MAVLAATDADILACETIPEMEEAVALLELLEELGASGWLSFTCADGERLRSGRPAVEAFALAERSERVLAVGINCTSPEHVDELVERAASITRKPIVVYPNSGEGWDPEAREWVGQPGMRVEPDAAQRWVEAGARLVGGCCRVLPADIAPLAAHFRG
jgi:homocysteine S-methyltransferase